MSTSSNTRQDVSPERIDEIIKAAHRERAEAISQLFGFGFTVLKEAVTGSRRTATAKADTVAGATA